jgi:RNA polymerase sigma-70 factor (ECF subfamily)
MFPVTHARVAGMAGEAAEWNDGGRAERFKALALPHLDDLYTLARYLMRGSAEADDAVQECYLRAFRHFETFRGGPIKPWLLAILRNVCLATYAGSGRLVYAESDDTVVPMWREDAETPEQSVLRQHASVTMRRLIGELPPEFREVIVLREINDLAYRDIATVIESPIGTVMSRLARAREMLRKAWIAAEGDIQ